MVFNKYLLNKIVPFAVLGLLLGCIFYFHKNNSLKKKIFREDDVCKVEVAANLLNKKSFCSLFPTSCFFTSHGVRKRYKAIKIDIKNKSERDFLLAKDSVDLILTDPLIIYKKLMSSFNLLPFFASGLASVACIFGFGLAFLPATIASGAAGVAANFVDVDGGQKKLAQNIRDHSYGPLNSILIPRKDQVSKIFFVENKNFKSKFNLKLFDLKSENYCDFIVNLS